MSVKAIPEGFRTITPYFSVRDAAKLIEFLKRTFDAKEIETMRMPDGTIMHATVEVGDSFVMIGQAAAKDLGDRNSLMPAMLYVYVNDADAIFKKAIEAGAKSLLEPMDQFYGDRSGAVEDIAGNQWWISTHKEDISTEELMKRASQRGQ
jgi:PhnB protein